MGARAPSPALGRLWTALIIGQVVLAVAVLPVLLSPLVRIRDLPVPEEALPNG